MELHPVRLESVLRSLYGWYRETARMATPRSLAMRSNKDAAIRLLADPCSQTKTTVGGGPAVAAAAIRDTAMPATSVCDLQ